MKTNYVIDMENKIRIRHSRETKEKVVNSILSGELWVEEAMEQFNVKDRRTVVKWLRKYVHKKGHAVKQ